MDAPAPPPPPIGPPAPPPDVSLRPSYGRLVLGGVLGAVIASSLATLLALQLAKPDVPAVAEQPSPADEGPAIAAVEGLTVEQPRWSADPTTWRLTLAWQDVEGAERYAVSRDGRRLDAIEATDFVDDDVSPTTRYRYEVVAIDADGHRSKAARAVIRTDALPKEAARVEGRWLVTLKVQSSNIGAGGGRIVMSLTPTCARGPCSVKWEFERVRNTGTARRDGADYQGTGTGSFFTLGCHGETISSSVTIDFTVKKARTVASEWRATSIAGTITESVGSFSNCLSTRNVWTFTGAAQG